MDPSRQRASGNKGDLAVSEKAANWGRGRAARRRRHSPRYRPSPGHTSRRVFVTGLEPADLVATNLGEPQRPIRPCGDALCLAARRGDGEFADAAAGGNPTDLVA